MNKIFFTSDLHINHRMVAKMRGFSTGDDINDVDLDQYHNTLITNWNSRIDDKDKVYILGDVCLTGKMDIVVPIVEQLNGEKILIVGNHDKKNLKKDEFRNLFSRIKDYYELSYNKNKICMSHFPFEFWNQKHHGSFMIHGHIHSKNPIRNKKQRKMDVGLDGNKLFPWEISEIYNLMLEIDYSKEDHHSYQEN